MDPQAAANPSEISRLLQQVAAGDQDLWGRILTQHRERLRCMVALRLDRRLQGRIDPSDVLQEAFLAASLQLPDYLRDPAIPLYLWLRLITGQQLVAVHRRHLGTQARDAGREVALYRGALPQATSTALAARLLGREPRPSEAAMQAERAVRLQQALDALDPLDREVLALRHFEQLSNAEAAQILSLRESAASKRYVRALQRLKEEGGDDVTGTGDLVGTLRYMAPERFRGQTDARCDVYSLGLTLYELLTLRPGFDGSDRNELVRRVTQEEPLRPRQLDRRIPRDLETVVLKATVREPARRYLSAAELAEDLRRFLEDRPIQARRPTWAQKVQKWSRRNRPVVWSAAVGLLATLAVLAGSIGWVMRDRTLRREQATREATAARADVDQLRREGKWAAALAVVRRVEALLADGDPDLRREFAGLGRDLEMAARLEEIRLRKSEVKAGRFDAAGADPEYARAFRGYGIDAEALEPAQAAERLRARAIREELAAALDDWASIREMTDERSAQRLRAAARATDPDPESNRLRDALENQDGKILEELAASDKLDGLPPSTLVLLAHALVKANAGARAEVVLRGAQRLHPDDFWISEELAVFLYESQPPRPEEAVRYYTAALALRPQNPAVHHNLGLALCLVRLPEAEAEFREAIRLKPDEAKFHMGLGNALRDRGKLSEAEAEYRRAIQLDPDYARVHYNLGGVRGQVGQWDRAAADYARAFELKLPEDPYYWLDRACLLLQLEDAEGYRNLCARMLEHYGQSKEVVPLSALAHTCVVGPGALPDAGLLVKLAEQRLGVTKPPSGHDAWSEHVLGLAYYRAGQYEKAVACLGKAPQDQPDWEHKVLNWLVLAMAEHRLGHRAAARQWLDQAEAWIKQKTPGAGQERNPFAIPGWHWRDSLMVQLFRREAEALLAREEPNNHG